MKSIIRKVSEGRMQDWLYISFFLAVAFNVMPPMRSGDTMGIATLFSGFCFGVATMIAFKLRGEQKAEEEMAVNEAKKPFPPEEMAADEEHRCG